MSWYPWFDEPWQIWRTQLNSGRLPQALRLSAAAGWGLTELAECLGFGLLCQKPGPSGLACGACHACRLLAQQNHPDWHWIAPPEKKSSLGIDQIRQLIEQAAKQSVLAARQVFVLDTADDLTLEAANALLKLLEEPGKDRLLLLLCHQPALLLPTLTSRCQSLSIQANQTQALAWLAQQKPQSDWPVRYCLSGEAPLPALDLTDAQFERLQNQLQALMAIGLQRQSPLEWDASDRASLRLLLDWLYRLSLQLLQLCMGCRLPSVSMLALAVPDAARAALVSRLDWQSLRQFIDELVQQNRQLSLSSSLNPSMQTDRLLIQWSKLFRGNA